MSGQKFYVVRLRKDDSIVAAGNSVQCAQRMGMSMASFYTTVSRCLSGENRRYIVDVEPWEEAAE